MYETAVSVISADSFVKATDRTVFDLIPMALSSSKKITSIPRKILK